MSNSSSDPLGETLRWLSRQAGFPRVRMSPAAEGMVLVAALAAGEEAAAAGRRFALERRMPGEAAALKTHVLRRTQVHYKCDNSAKV